ncbi:MAG: hypothetical protein ACXW3Z_11730, partial [Limisphaerales bacterium]
MQQKYRTSTVVPLSFIASGMVALLIGIACIAARPEILSTYHYNQHVIAITHLITLGWICSVVMGAVYQLVPVALETKLHNERLAQVHCVLHLIGFAGMARMFWIWNIQLAACFGLVLGTGVALFVYNIGRTLWRIPRWSVVATGVTSALTWLALTILAGLLLAAAKLWPISRFDPISQMHAHAHLGGLGFFVILIVGVSYKLVPMFVLSEIQNPRRARASIVLLNMGLAGLFVTLLLNSALKLAFAAIVVAGLAIYGWELATIVRARKRRALDWGLKYFLTAIGLLVPVSLLGLGLAQRDLPLNALTGQLENVYGLLALLGVVTFAIIGMLYKIVPFLVWYARYSGEIGRKKVPSLADLYSARLQMFGYWVFLAGLTLTTMGTMLGHAECVQRGASVWLLGIGIFSVNIAKI